MSSPKQMMDFKPVKSIAANVSNEQQRNWSDELFERKAKNPDHNYDRTRTDLNFQVGPGGVITSVDKSRRIGDRVEEIIKKHLRPDARVTAISNRAVMVVFGGNRERMREMAFGSQDFHEHAEMKSFEVGLLVHPAVMFMNSNKSEGNIRRIIQENRQKCSMAGIALMNECIINKGPNRDIDRDAVNMLITRLISGQYDTVVVENMADITADESDLEEFMHDAANIGVGFFELSTMQYHMYDTTVRSADKERPIWDGGTGC